MTDLRQILEDHGIADKDKLEAIPAAIEAYLKSDAICHFYVCVEPADTFLLIHGLPERWYGKQKIRFCAEHAKLLKDLLYGDDT